MTGVLEIVFVPESLITTAAMEGELIIRKIKDGLVDVSHTMLFCGKWARIQVKRQHVCALSGRVIPIDSLAYRPLTVSRLYRKQRVHISAMEQR